MMMMMIILHAYWQPGVCCTKLMSMFLTDYNAYLRFDYLYRADIYTLRIQVINVQYTLLYCSTKEAILIITVWKLVVWLWRELFISYCYNCEVGKILELFMWRRVNKGIKKVLVFFFFFCITKPHSEVYL